MQNKSKLNTILLIVIIVLLVIGLVYIFLNKNSKQKNNELINQNINTISSDGKEYTFINPKCVIAGSSDRSGTVTWFMGIRFIADQSKESGIYFDIKNINNTVDSYLQKDINVATKDVVINNTFDSYGTKPYSDISVVWNDLNKTNKTFSGKGYIELKNDIKPNEDMCNHLKTSDPDYKAFCPTPIIPAQKIYFSCDNGLIYPKPAGLIY
ncbi:MAG TPA: hypothetical protein VMR49_02000 [Candidatus Paceibacterota bacterium]|jgi:hypothetical protein|nr:hypothetical protein [Candidatus Paceibacterota bacterium]